MYRNILVPIDSEGLSDRALEHAIGLSGALGSRLTLMTVAADAHVTHEASSSEVPPSRAARMFHRAAGRLRDAGVAFETCVYCGERMWEGITMAADDHQCDLIVMASRGGEHMDGFVFGSVAASVVTRSHVPILVVKEPEED
ncbi:MAG: universal stress protein [Rhodoblastus sp.]